MCQVKVGVLSKLHGLHRHGAHCNKWSSTPSSVYTEGMHHFAFKSFCNFYPIICNLYLETVFLFHVLGLTCCLVIYFMTTTSPPWFLLDVCGWYVTSSLSIHRSFENIWFFGYPNHHCSLMGKADTLSQSLSGWVLSWWSLRLF